jgi:hypothetical protein
LLIGVRDFGDVGDWHYLFAVAVGDGGAALGHEFRCDVTAVVFVVEGECLVAEIAEVDAADVELLAEVDEEPDVVPGENVCGHISDAFRF